LESEIGLEVLCDFSDQSLERELSDEELGRPRVCWCMQLMTRGKGRLTSGIVGSP
jgi:hypothetical protein